MPLYDFRLRFNFSKTYRIDSDAEEIELLVLPHGERIRLLSDSMGKAIKDYDKAAVLGGPFISEALARAAAEKSKFALLYWAIEQRLGIDFGDGKQRSFATNAYLTMLEKKHGHPFRNDIHGIDIYEHVKKLKFLSLNAEATVGKYPPNLINTFQREYSRSRLLTEKEALAGEIYASSFFDITPRSRFITLVTAVEALLEPLKRSNKAEELIEEFKGKTRLAKLDQQMTNSIIGSLELLKYQSVRQAGRLLVGRLIPNEFFDGQPSADFFTRCYDYRSQILHTGTIAKESVDMLDLANVMESFVARLLIAALNDESK